MKTNEEQSKHTVNKHYFRIPKRMPSLNGGSHQKFNFGFADGGA